MSCTLTVRRAFLVNVTKQCQGLEAQRRSQWCAASGGGAAVIGSSPVALACAYQLLKCCHHFQNNPLSLRKVPVSILKPFLRCVLP